MNYRISTAYARLSDANLNTKAQTVITSMTGNPYFPGPIPQLTAMTTAGTEYNEALIAAQSRDVTKVSIKNQKREVLLDAMKELALYVLLMAKNDRTVLISSGFDLNKAPEPAPPINQPADVMVADGINPGELLVKVDKVTGAKSYQFEYTTDVSTENINWVSKTSTTVQYLFSNLEIGRRYYCRVAVIGSYGQMVYSNLVSRIVQ